MKRDGKKIAFFMEIISKELNEHENEYNFTYFLMKMFSEDSIAFENTLSYSRWKGLES